MEQTVGAGVRAAQKSAVGGVLFRRWLGCWIDFVAAALLFVSAAIPFVGKAVLSDGEAITVFLLGLLLVLAYFTLTEGLVGRTLGKLLTGTIVVTAEGRPPGVGRALVRTLLRLVEVNPLLLGGLPAGICVALTQTNGGNLRGTPEGAGRSGAGSGHRGRVRLRPIGF